MHTIPQKTSHVFYMLSLSKTNTYYNKCFAKIGYIEMTPNKNFVLRAKGVFGFSKVFSACSVVGRTRETIVLENNKSSEESCTLKI